MGRHQHVRVAHQQLEPPVHEVPALLERDLAEVLEEKRRLVLVDVQSKGADDARVDGVEHCAGVDQALGRGREREGDRGQVRRGLGRAGEKKGRGGERKTGRKRPPLFLVQSFSSRSSLTSAGHVDNHRPRLELPERVFVDQVLRGGVQRDVQRKNVGFSEEGLLGVDVLRSERPRRGVGDSVVGLGETRKRGGTRRERERERERSR